MNYKSNSQFRFLHDVKPDVAAELDQNPIPTDMPETSVETAKKVPSIMTLNSYMRPNNPTAKLPTSKLKEQGDFSKAFIKT